MRVSPLLDSVLRAHGLASLPSEDDVQKMSPAEKETLYEKQKQILIHYREESQQQVVSLRTRVDSAISVATELGIRLSEDSEPLTRSSSEGKLFDDQSEVPAAQVPQNVPILVQPRVPRPGGRRGRAEHRYSYDFTYADRRLKQIDREINCITKRFKKFKIGAFYCTRPYYSDRH